jgi:hypothetical protein
MTSNDGLYTRLIDCPMTRDYRLTEPKSYHRPLLFVSYKRTFGLKRLMRKVMGDIIPCQRPPRKPAGFAPASLSFEFGPATEREFAIDIISWNHEGENFLE